MGALRRTAAAFALALTLGIAPCLAREGADWRVHVGEAAARFALPEAWVLRVIAAESGGRTHLGGKPITSHAGAIGLMQVMPATWASLRARYRLGPDPHDPRDNIVAGTAYLREMYDRFGYPGLFAAYNAGPGRYGDYLERGRPLPRETRDYVAKITGGAPAPRFIDGRDQSAPALADTRTGWRDRDARSADPRDPDPIFHQRTIAGVPTPVAGATGDRSLSGKPPRGLGHGSVMAADSLFLLRKPAATDAR